jgi:heat-inducible transcriptional repressor
MLNERKIHILEAIINDYIISGEPVGSRTISKKYNFGLSSATIRNEMSDLEEMGYITQPHASAGRAPTDKGYRLYVDKLMKIRQLNRDEIDYLERVILTNIDHIDYLMEESAKAISMLTSYTAVAASAKPKGAKIKLLQLLPVDEHSAALVFITSDKTVKNTIINMRMPSYADLSEFSAILNAELSGKSAAEITPLVVSRITEKSEKYSDLIPVVLETVFKFLEDAQTSSLFLSGAKNILEFPEFSDINKAKDILQTFEEKDLMITLLDYTNNAEGSEGVCGDNCRKVKNIQIVIGDENNARGMKGCSVLTTSLTSSGKDYGTIGVLGPTRMDYSQAASVLNVIIKYMNKTIKALTGG